MFPRNLVAAVLLLVVTAIPAVAELPSPAGRVVLTVMGAIAQTNVDGAAKFDRDMMRRLDWQEVETFTSFTAGPQRFAGPTLASLLAAVGADGSRLTARAINDYFVEIPVAHARAHNVILAMEMNGKPMRIRDKGPIWVVYPLSAAEAAQKPFNTEMIWQLTRIEIID